MILKVHQLVCNIQSPHTMKCISWCVTFNHHTQSASVGV